MRNRPPKDKSFTSQLWRLALPIALQSLLLASVAAADAFMLANVEQDSMAAVSLASQIQFIQNMLLMAVTGTQAILGAQYWGKGDTNTLRKVFGISIRANGLISVAFCLGCIAVPGLLMRLYTNETALIQIGMDYLRVAGWSYLLTGISQCYLTNLKISDHTAEAAIVSGIAVVLNIVLNAVFIYGCFGLPAMGAIGAAAATLIARAVELALSVALSLRSGYIRLRLSTLWQRNRELGKDFMRCTLPLIGAGLLWGVGFTSYTSFMGHMGTDAAAANSIASVIRDLICCAGNGLAAGGGILIGNQLGKGDLEKGKQYGDRLVRISFICGFVSMIFMMAITPAILSLIRLTREAHNLLLGMMIVMAVYMLGRSINAVLINGIFSAGGDTAFDMYSLVVTMWMIAVPLAALGTFVFHWSPLIVYACTCLDEVGKIPWVLIHYRKYKWVKDLTRTL